MRISSHSANSGNWGTHLLLGRSTSIFGLPERQITGLNGQVEGANVLLTFGGRVHQLPGDAGELGVGAPQPCAGRRATGMVGRTTAWRGEL